MFGDACNGAFDEDFGGAAWDANGARVDSEFTFEFGGIEISHD